MGTNRRYPDLGERRLQEQQLADAAKHGPLQTLSAEQLRLGSVAVTIAPERPLIWAMAWLRFGDRDVYARVRVLRWTNDAVGVGVEVGGQAMRCWVWQGAVTRSQVPE